METDRDLRSQAEDVIQIMRSAKVDEELTQIIESKLYAMVESQRRASDQTRQYLDKILRRMWKAFQAVIVTTELVDEVLLSLNFNFRAYFINYLRRLEAHLKLEESVNGKLEFLAFKNKKVLQATVERGMEYTDSYPTLQEIIANWIAEEISFLERTEDLKRASTPSASLANFRFLLDLSVAQLTCMTKAFKESGILLNTNITELSKGIAKIVITKRSETISDRNFLRKYHNIETATRASVIDRLNQAISWLKRSV